MRKLMFVATASLVALALGGAPAYASAPATPTALTCTQAQEAYNESVAALKAAQAADDAAADAKAADAALVTVKADLAAAVGAAQAAGAAVGEQTELGLGIAQTALVVAEAQLKTAQDAGLPTGALVEAVAKVKAKIAAIKAVLALQVKVDAALKLANSTDADALAAEAAKTDVVVLTAARDEAHVLAEKTCNGTTTTVTPTPIVHPPNCNCGEHRRVITEYRIINQSPNVTYRGTAPSGGVETGFAPA